MKIERNIKYGNEGGLECWVILFDDGSAAITGSINYIIEESDDALQRAEFILDKHGYKRTAEIEPRSDLP